MPTMIVVGAGVSGLAVAYRLGQRLPDAEILVLEEAQRSGGTAWTVREQGFQVEIGPNGFLDTKPSTAELCRDIGLGQQLITASAAAARNRYLFLGEKLHLLPRGPGDLLRTDLLSWRGKLSLLWERFRRPLRDGRDESIDVFARRRAGAEAAEIFADGLVTGIYAGDPALLSLPACFPRVAELERVHGSVIRGLANTARQRSAEAKAAGKPYERTGKMWSFAGGLRVMSETLAAALKTPPVYGALVRRIEPNAGRWIVRGEGQDRWSADAVVLTCPAYKQASIVADLDGALAESIAAIPYNRIAVVALAYRRDDVPHPLDGFGFIAPQRLKRDVLGVQWCSSIYPQRAPDGTVLLRALCGGWQRGDVVSWDDERLSQAVQAELRLALGVTGPPVFRKIVRWERGIPQYHVGHLERLAGIEERLTRHPGLFLGGNAYRGVALNDCTEQGGILADSVTRYLATASTNPNLV
jgi:protoporphyrinogen/coproporphyrinogen III oxidase